MFVRVKGALHGRCRHKRQHRICPQSRAARHACRGVRSFHHPAHGTDPTETVTIALLDLAEEGTQLTYSNVGAALTGRAESLIGVERMLDALQSSLADLRR